MKRVKSAYLLMLHLIESNHSYPDLIRDLKSFIHDSENLFNLPVTQKKLYRFIEDMTKRNYITADLSKTIPPRRTFNLTTHGRELLKQFNAIMSDKIERQIKGQAQLQSFFRNNKN